MGTTIHDDTLSEGSLAELFYQELFADPLLRTFYGDSGYANLGYWDETTATAGAAGDRLVDVLLDLIPDRTRRAPGNTILDVACGQGGTTRRLARHFGTEQVIAIGISDAQLADAGRRAPGCTFHRMSPTDLQFASGTFDIVCCVEAAFHFRTRQLFFSEARRILKPGGHLILSDLLMAPGTPLVPAENYVPNQQVYEAILERCGFGEIQLIDVTDATWRSFRRRLNSFLFESATRYGSPIGIRDLLAVNTALAWSIRASVLAVGRTR